MKNLTKSYTLAYNPGNAYTKLCVAGEDKAVVMTSGVEWKFDGEDRVTSKDFKISRDPSVRIPLFAKGAWWVSSITGAHPFDHTSGGKAVYALPLLITAMWERLEQDDVERAELNVHVLVHDPKNMAADIRSRMTGEFHITHNKSSKIIVVNVVTVKREGAYVMGLSSSVGTTVLLDWGGNTLITTKVRDRKSVAGFSPTPLDGCGSAGLARLLINEAGPLIGGSKTFAVASKFLMKPNLKNDDEAQTFSAICDIHLEQALEQALYSSPGLFVNAERVVCFGGLCNNKFFVEALKRRKDLADLKIVPNPQTVDILRLSAWLAQENADK